MLIHKLLITTAGIALASAASPAFAQAELPAGQTQATCDPTNNPDCPATAPVQAGPSIPSVARDAEGQEATSNDVFVTGSRIPRPRNLTSLEPSVTVTKDYIEARGLTNIADALNEQPLFRGSVTPAGAQSGFGQGVNFVNQFGLGSNRTLVLVNGRRFVTSNVPSLFGPGSAGTQVDLNVLPTIAVDHIDNISIGGAPVYGSDAIAGTTNIILRNRFTGLEVDGTSGITQEGDNFSYNISAIAGVNFAGGRGNFTIAGSRDEVKGLLYNDRGFLRDNLGNATNPSPAQAAALRGAGFPAANDGRVDPTIGYNTGSADGIPGSVLIRDERIYYLTQGGLLTYADNGADVLNNVIQGYQFDPSGNVVPFNKGTLFPSIYASGGDGFRFSDYSQITSNLNRDSIAAFGSYDVSDALHLFAEGNYYHSRADQLVTQPTFNSNLFGGESAGLLFDISNPFLTNQARTQLAALGVQTFEVSRASIDLADTSGFATTNLYRGVIGANGDFNIGSRKFHYDVSGVYGQTDIHDFTQDLNAQNFVNAVNVTTDATGKIVCTTGTTNAYGYATQGTLTPVADPACVPLNLLGLNQSSAAARAYVIQQNEAKSRLEQYDFNANVGGSLFDLFNNPIGFSIGYEHREEKGSFNPSAFEQQGLGRSSAITPLSGKYHTNEVYGEISAPIITPDNNLRFLNELQLYARGRHVQNTVNGGFLSYAVGGEIAPIKDIKFRGNFTRSFRNPAITELFLPQSPAFDAVDDVCAPGAINAGPAPANRAKNCAAFLAVFPNATPLDAAGATVPVLSGGNPNLDNEVANSYSFGGILQPRFIPGLVITADYLHINIKHPIASLGESDIVSACFDNAEFNASDPANGNAFCSLIKRYPVGSTGTAANGGSNAGQVVNDPATPGVLELFTNGNRYLFEGIEATLSYTIGLEGIHMPGQVVLNGNMVYTAKRINDITGVAPQRIDGTLGDPTFAGILNLGYIGEQFGFISSFNYTGEQLFSRVSRGPDIREFDKLNDFVTINPSFYVDVEKKFRFNFSVTNLLNRHGQKFNGFVIPASYSDLIGRRYTASVRMKFK